MIPGSTMIFQTAAAQGANKVKDVSMNKVKDASMNAIISEGQDVEMTDATEEVVEENAKTSEDELAEPPLAGDKFIIGMGAVLKHWVEEMATATRPKKVARFHSSRAPAISIQDYIRRLRKFFACSDECFVIALVYIDRLGKNNDAMAVCDVTVHRLLIIAVMLAAKFHDDQYYNNRYYAKVGGLQVEEANVLEIVMLKELKWQLVVSTEEYRLYHGLVCQAVKC